MIALTARARPRSAQECSRCGAPRGARIELRAQPAHSRGRPLATLARGFCEDCALNVFAALEFELERQITGASPRVPVTTAGRAHNG